MTFVKLNFIVVTATFIRQLMKINHKIFLTYRSKLFFHSKKNTLLVSKTCLKIQYFLCFGKNIIYDELILIFIMVINGKRYSNFICAIKH